MKFFKKVQNNSDKLTIVFGVLTAFFSAITAITNLIQKDYQTALFFGMTMCFYTLLSVYVKKEMNYVREIKKLKNEQ